MNSRLFESNIGLPLALAPPVGLRHFQPATQRPARTGGGYCLQS
jgi:hypothetical protein